MVPCCLEPWHLIKTSNIAIKNELNLIFRTSLHFDALTNNVDNTIADMVNAWKKFHIGDLLIHQVGMTAPNIEFLGKLNALLVSW